MKSKNNLAGTIILYHPADDIIRNIDSYLSHLDVLYIFDNSPHQNQAIPDHFASLEKVKYFHDSQNLGIAVRLNQALRLAEHANCKWLLTMDQDSFFADGEMEKYISKCTSFEQKEGVAMFGVEFVPRNFKPACKGSACSALITSGSIINLSVTRQIGDFDEKLFIDEVDLEFCYRARYHGFKIVQFQSIFLHHSLGTSILGRSLKSFKKTKRTIHSPERIYYMVRNFLYVNQKYPQLFPLDNPGRKMALLNRLKNNLLYGQRKRETVKYLFKAYFDFKNNRMGQLAEAKS